MLKIGDGRKQQRSGRKTSRREPEHDRPVDVIGKMVAPAPSRLGDRSIEQVGTDRELEISRGVISEPPPTPARPTRKPTLAPAATSGSKATAELKSPMPGKPPLAASLAPL